MRSARPNSQILRFGVFEADLLNGEIRKHGLRIKLQNQPFLLLATLLTRDGAIVSREELRTTLWSEDTFVEFDQGINAAMQKIRRTLNDSAANPRFIETVRRRGYRFITPVQVTGRTPAHRGHAGEDRGLSGPMARVAELVERGLSLLQLTPTKTVR